MRYYYFNPFSKQYYFPKGFQKIHLFASFYQPYTFAGSLLWFVWKNLWWVRRFCREEFIENVLPIKRFQKYLPPTAIMAINRGTEGIEQKMSILAYDPVSGEEYFLKYAENEISRKNVDNEGKVLTQLNHLDFVPKLYLHVSETDYTLIQTNILKGERLSTQKVDEQILEVLIELSKQNVNTGKTLVSELQCCFAHGDFCPWNMMVDGDRLNVFDWEMGGTYPLGYDLFTYVFQTSILLQKNISFNQLVEEKKDLFQKYFSSLKIDDWLPYFNAFLNIKIECESLKSDNKLLIRFLKIKKLTSP